MKGLLILALLIETVIYSDARKTVSANKYESESDYRSITLNKNNHLNYEFAIGNDETLYHRQSKKVKKPNKKNWIEIGLVKRGDLLEVFKPIEKNNSYQRSGVVIGITDKSLREINNGKIVKVKYLEEIEDKSCGKGSKNNGTHFLYRDFGN